MHFPGNSETNHLMRWMPDAWPIFFHKRGPRPIQQNAIPLILRGESVFLTAPTASGKTEAVIAPLYQRHISFKRDNLSVLYIAPTKALVNDIYYRLGDYLGVGKEFSGVCRYTGDHHDFKEPAGAFALISTPEALDSLQLRYPQKLEHIRAIVVDEVHFIHGKARGEQLRYVIDRVRSKSKTPINPKDVFQVVAMSATLNDMESVGRLWAGDLVKYVAAEDPREIEMDYLPVPEGKIENQVVEIASAIRNYIETSKLEKVLIFANSRNDAHLLSVALNDAFTGTRWPVYLHFGILETKVRDEIESDLKTKHYGICVCTSTLELGIDIGDVETIMLLSPPPSVSSFLQRIGRGSRRSEICRVVTLVRNDNERVIYEALLDLARRGKLEPVHEYTRPSVAFQQILSHAWQGLRKEKPLTLKNLAAKTGGHDFSDVVNDMLEEGHLKLNQGALIPSDSLIDLGDRSVIHSVIAGDGAKPVYDGVTGDLIASIGAGAGDGLYFLGGTLRRIASAERNSYVLEQVAPKGPRQIGKIPAARGGRGISRTLVWKIAEMTGHNPRSWSWNNDRLVTWGGWVNNLLLKFLLEQHGYGKASGFDAFALEGISKRDEINPEAISELVRNSGIHLSLREAEKFRDPSKYYQYLSTALKTKEAEGAIPIPEFTQWLNDCMREAEQTDEIDQIKSDSVEEVVNQHHEENKEAIEKSEPILETQTTYLKLQLKWEHDGEKSAFKFAEAIVSLFFNESAKVVVTTENEISRDALELKEYIDLIKAGKQVQIVFLKNSQVNSEIELLSLFVDPGEGETQSPVCVIKLTASESYSLLESPRNLSWYQSDFDFLSPIPLLALPQEKSEYLDPTALHGLVALANECGDGVNAVLLNENSSGDEDVIARWYKSCPEDGRQYYPVVPLAGDCLWMAKRDENHNHPSAALWLEIISSIPIQEYTDLRDQLAGLFLESSPDLEKINHVLREAMPIPVRVVPLADHVYPTLMTPAQENTALVLSPDGSAVTLGVDLRLPQDLLLDSILHGVGHVLLGHVRPIDEYGHTDTAYGIRGQGTLRLWDREVRETQSPWFTSEQTTKAESITDCTTQEKAMLGLWRMIGEMLGESRRLHRRAEEYQHAAYQRQAAQRLLAQLEEYGGAMLCDGVGLGKTYVATTLMVHYANAWRDRYQETPDALLSDPFRITILAPNSVVSTWKREALPPLASHGVPLTTVRVISHTKLSRISKASEVLEAPSRKDLSDMEHLLLSDLVIVDEAHNFRSVAARRTIVLRDLLRLQPRKDQRRKVLILTATPINNTLDDLMQETALLFSKPLWLSDAATEEGYHRQAIKEITSRCAKARSSKGPKGDVSPLLIHGNMDSRFAITNDFRDDLDFGPNVQRIGDYLKEQNSQLEKLQQEIREEAETGRKRVGSETTRIAEELLDRIVVQRSRDLCKAIERQQGSDVDLLFRSDAGLPEKLCYSDEYDGIHDLLAGFLPLFDRGDRNNPTGARPISLKVYMWYDVREGLKSWDDVSSVVGLQRMLILKRLESSPVSFLITLLRLTILYAFRLQQLISLCEKMHDGQRKDILEKAISKILKHHDDSELEKIVILSIGDVEGLPRQKFLKRLGDAYAQRGIPAAESDDAPAQLSLFEPEDDEKLEQKEQLDRLWGLKDDLLEDFVLLLGIIPGLADVIFGKFKRDEWPKKFTLGGMDVDWPTSAGWGLRIVTDAKIRTLVARLIEARHQGQKVIVFSQFSDTLAYVHSVLNATRSFEKDHWRIVLPALNTTGIKAKDIKDLIDETGVITGDTEDRDGMVNAFSPFYRIGPFPPPTDSTSSEEKLWINDSWRSAWQNALQRPIQVLLSSDILAEGVNLQDAAALINFDVHWNPVRMIQRAGRIDRRLNPRIEKTHSYPELEELARQIGRNVPCYYWHDHEKEAPLTINMILPDELERELLLRERIALKTLAIDFTLGLDQGTGAEAEWMENYKYQGISSLNAFQKDRAIEQIAGYHEKYARLFKDRGIEGQWAENLNSWIQAGKTTMGAPLVGRALLGRRDGTLEKFSRYLEPVLHKGVPYWFWSEKTPGNSLFDGWLIMDGRQENFPPRLTRDIPWNERVSLPVKASQLLAVALYLESGPELRILQPQEIGRPLMQGATALAAPKLGSEEDRRLIAVRDFLILQLPDFDPEKLGRKIS